MALGSTPQSTITREQKTGIVLLLVFGMLAVGLGFLQMRNTIYDPFVIRIDETKRDLTALLDNTEARLQQIDTDHDGFTDYDELTFYGTSPYLPDTDSDGIRDKDEIDAGTDPSCPQGQVCTVEEILPRNSSSTVASPLLQLQTSTPSIVGVSSGTETASSSAMSVTDLQALINNPAALRQLLSATGQISEEQLQAISDESLVRMAQEQFEKSLVRTSTPNSINAR